MTIDEHNPKSLLLQWHITDRCNLRCAHCYHDTYSGRELGFDDWLAILEQFKSFLSSRSSDGRPALRGHINVTGGEPFARPEFPRLLDVFAAHRPLFSFAVLSNGTLIDAALARRLADWQVGFVQVSIDGNRATHDRIRGAGNYDRVVEGVGHLVTAGVRTVISFTANRANFRDFEEVARLAKRLKVWRVWADRLIPCGQGESLREQLLTPEETRELFELMGRARAEARRGWFNRTEVSMRRALQFLVGGEEPYRCTAGDSLVTVMPNGDVYPCRRLPIRAGNLQETTLDALYSCDLFRALRDRKRCAAGCEDCLYTGLCRGGLRCLAHAVTGDPFTADPGCWLARVPAEAPAGFAGRSEEIA